MTGTEPSPSEIVWPPVPGDFKLEKQELQVLGASLAVSESRLTHLARALSPAEHARAARFCFDKDRRRFIASRGLLREMLGLILQVEPNVLAFHYSARGKPAVAAPANGHSLHFNLAHSDGLAVYAVAWDHEVGVDIERLRPIKGAEAIARRFFSEKELSQWREVPSRLRMEAFFNCWTRKEACLKATGEGITESLSQIEVSLIPGQPARLLSLAGASEAGNRWLLQSLLPGPGYLGAVAVPHGAHLRVKSWKW